LQKVSSQFTHVLAAQSQHLPGSFFGMIIASPTRASLTPKCPSSKVNMLPVNKPRSRLKGFMLVHLLKSKLHRARVTDVNVDYEGSLTIDRDLMDRVGLSPCETILCSNAMNGARFETYAIPGERGSGAIVLNGAAALLGKPGDRLTIMSFADLDFAAAQLWKPRVIVLGEANRIAFERPEPEPALPAVSLPVCLAEQVAVP
jgi:aspartate 1-decarboxylase